MQGQHNKLK